MNQLMTVTQVSRACGVSARMLRHYEKTGLITSTRVEDYAYRMYDRQAVARLVQILVLRRLRIPLKEIALILQDEDPARRQEVFRSHIARLEAEAAALETIRGILGRLVDHAGDPAWLTSPEMLSLTDALAPEKTTLKEEGTVTDRNNIGALPGEKLNVRILHLPPMTVASYHYTGPEPEETAGGRMSRFLRESRLYDLKPDARMFGFNHPNPGILENGLYGYEVWVTIPEDFPLPEDIVRKQFPGGLYAALTIRFPEFQYWWELNKWVEASEDFAIDWRGDEGTMGGCLEEHLNWVRSVHLGQPGDGTDGQLDLLFPVKGKK